MKPGRNRNEIFAYILLAILGIGLFLRVYNLGGESLWNDEAGSIRLSHMSVSAIIKNRAHSVHPPLYFLLLRYWVIVFGDSEFAARFLSVLFGFAAIFMIYKNGSALFDKEVGILASLLLAFSTFHIRYSQEARGYSLMVLLTLLSIYFFQMLPRERHRWRNSVGYLLSTSLLIYTHYYGFFIVFAQLLFACLVFILSRDASRLYFKKWFLLQCLLMFSYVPWLKILIKQLMKVHRQEDLITTVSIHTLYHAFWSYFENTGLMVLILMLVILSLFSLRKTEAVDSRNSVSLQAELVRRRVSLQTAGPVYFFLLLWLCTPILLPFVVSHLAPRFFQYRYTISASLAIYLLAAKGISNLTFKSAKGTAVILVAVLSLTTTWEYYTKVQKEQWREVASYVDTCADSGDLILFHATFIQKGFDYYSRRTDLFKAPFPKKGERLNDETIQELPSAVKDHDRVWLILAHSRDTKGLMLRALGVSRRQVSHLQFKGIEVYLFDRGMGREAPRLESSGSMVLGLYQLRTESVRS